MLCTSIAVQNNIVQKTKKSKTNTHTSDDQYLPIIFRFSQEFMIYFISSYLDLKSLGLLDKAITNRRLRRCYWLEYLSCQNFLLPVIDTTLITNISYNLWKWFMDRQINLKNIKIVNNQLKEININASNMNNEDFLHIIHQVIFITYIIICLNSNLNLFD